MWLSPSKALLRGGGEFGGCAAPPVCKRSLRALPEALLEATLEAPVLMEEPCLVPGTGHAEQTRPPTDPPGVCSAGRPNQ